MKSMWIMKIISWFCFICLNFAECQYCPTEESVQHGSLITWNSTEPSQVISHPICINNRYEIAKRYCSKSRQWHPSKPPNCEFIQHKYEPNCPNGYINKNNLCIYVSEPQKWQQKCPFPDESRLSQEQLKTLFQMNITEFWLAIKRSQPFGEFVSVRPIYFNSKFTHLYLNDTIENKKNMNDCVAIKLLNVTGIDENGTEFEWISFQFEIVNCNSKFKQVCIYSLKSSYSSTTSTVTCPHSKNNICYALSFRSIVSYRDDFCDKLATPTTQLENYIIKNLLAKESCWIGHKRNEMNKFQWDNSKGNLEYTDWKTDVDFTKDLGAITMEGWELHNGHWINCGVCEVDINSIEINLTLKPDYKLGLLVLTVYSPRYFFNEERFTCNAVGLSDITLFFTIEKVVKNNQNEIFNKFSIREDRTVYFLQPHTAYYNYYYCKGIILPKGDVISTKKVLFGYNDIRNEYALQLMFQNISDEDLNIIYNTWSDQVLTIRPMKIVSIANNSLEIIMHIYAEENKTEPSLEYLHVKDHLPFVFGYLWEKYELSSDKLKNCFYCLEHWTPDGLHWGLTEVGSTVMPTQLCLNSSGFPVTRTCLGDFISGAEWSEEYNECSKNIEYSTTTKSLHDFYMNISNFSTDEVITSLTSLTKDSYNLTPNDIYYISQILKLTNFSTESNSTSVIYDIVSIVNNLMTADLATLKLSNQLLNSTNAILDVTENIIEEFKDLDLNEDGVLQVITPYLFYQVSDVSLNNITGVIMYGPSDKKSFLDYEFKILRSNTDIYKLVVTTNLEVATFIPQNIIEEIKKETKTIRVYISIFYNHSLFIEDEGQDMIPGSKIVSVSIMGYENYLSSPIPLIFRNKLGQRTNSSCSYWSFGQNTYEEKYPTKWANDGGIRWDVSYENIEVCGFTHLTHFALLLGEPSILLHMAEEVAIYHDRALSIITAVGCFLSAFGITAILITTIMFKSWRQKTGTKLLLNLSASVIIQISIIFVADTEKITNNEKSCIIIGCILHYSTLASFCWMLVIAYLQYLRFVKVFSITPPHLILKSCVIGWILPIVFVASLLIWDPNSYNPMTQSETTKLCFPHGVANYITVLLPVGIILIINIFIFCKVLYSISHEIVSTKTKNQNHNYIKLKLAILLFFLLGLTWIFGFITILSHSLVCLYLFCGTATSQGFVLFIFYVVLDSNTRKLWTSVLKPISCIHLKKSKGKWYVPPVTEDTQEMTTSSFRYTSSDL